MKSSAVARAGSDDRVSYSRALMASPPSCVRTFPAVRGIGPCADNDQPRCRGISRVWTVVNQVSYADVASTNRVGTNTGAKTQRIMTISQYQRTGRLTSHRTFAMAPGLGWVFVLLFGCGGRCQHGELCGVLEKRRTWGLTASNY